MTTTECVMADIRQLASGTLASLTGLSGYASLEDVRTAWLCWAELQCDADRSAWETWQDSWNDFAAAHPFLKKPEAKLR